MTEEDEFFTHTIVGPALSLYLGYAAAGPERPGSGLQVDMRNATTSLDHAWKEWILVQGAYPYVGLPRSVPGALRRKIERHALLIAVFGLVLSFAALVVAVAILGLPMLNK